MELAPFEMVEERDRPIVVSSNRYEVGYQLADGTYLYDLLLHKKRIPESENDLYHDVSSGEEGKLDIVAYHYYGTVELWWVIAMANDILNPLRLAAGTRLRIPSIDRIYQGVV